MTQVEAGTIRSPGDGGDQSGNDHGAAKPEQCLEGQFGLSIQVQSVVSQMIY